MIGVPYGCVELYEYDPAWPALFEQEKARLLAALAGEIIAIEHVGSTSVPGLPAKATLDLLAGVRELAAAEHYRPRLESLGYRFRPDHPVDGRLHFARILPAAGDCPALRTHNLSLTVYGSGFWRQHLAFRDLLRSRSDLAAEYAALKRRLAPQFTEDTVGYTEAKREFIEMVLAQEEHYR